MSKQTDQFPNLSALLRGALGDLLATDAETFLDMVAEDIVMEFPYAPMGGVPRLEGKAALAAYLPGVARLITIDTMSAPQVYRATEPGVVVLEFSCTGRSNATGLPYDQQYISVIGVRDGRIVHYRDYWNPLIVLRAVGGDDAIANALKGSRNGV